MCDIEILRYWLVFGWTSILSGCELLIPHTSFTSHIIAIWLVLFDQTINETVQQYINAHAYTVHTRLAFIVKRLYWNEMKWLHKTAYLTGNQTIQTMNEKKNVSNNFFLHTPKLHETTIGVREVLWLLRSVVVEKLICPVDAKGFVNFLNE